jgi:hypothetical protein
MWRSFYRTRSVVRNPLLFLVVGVFVAAWYVGAAAGLLVWLVLKGIWFVLVVLPARIIVNRREAVRVNQLGRAKDRMQEYMDGR